MVLFVFKLNHKRKDTKNIKLPPYLGKCLFFKKDVITVYMAQYTKSRSLFNIVGYITSIDSFYQQYVLIKGLLLVKQLNHPMIVIELDMKLTSRTIYKKIYMENTKKPYKKSYIYDEKKV